ncbi:hypothetical protein Taro_004533 [Colocasia esculenta]|uniref:GRAM domain-containing protein n=1 Tax=Colocasia esculenta TaxID=4460 RepID=A0A843TRX0_COLES|nr:hypothetical protein [Colocasia esculenta]
MKSASHGAVVGFPIGAKEVKGKPVCDAVSSRIASTSYGSSQFKQKRAGAVIRWMNKFSKKADSYVRSLQKHVRFGPKLADQLERKLNLDERILQAGGVEGAYAQIFAAGEEEKLLKALHCCLSTTAGPIAGMLFISTDKIAFHSDRSLRVTSPKGEVIRIPYKVTIPLRKVKKANLNENLSKPLHKYIHITTVDNFEFWFMGFASCNRSFKHVKQARCFAQ